MATTANLEMTMLTAGQQETEATINNALNTIDLRFAADLGEVLLADLPAAEGYPDSYALVTDAAGGRTIVRSDGTDWKIVAVEGATVS